MHCVLKNNRSLEWRPWHCHMWSNFLAGLPFDFWKIANFANLANLANHNSLKRYHCSLDDSSELPHHVAPGVLHVVRIGCRFRLKYLSTFNYKFCLKFLIFQFQYFHSYKNCVNSLWRQAPPDASHVLRSFLRLKSLLCLIPLPASRQANFDHKRKFRRCFRWHLASTKTNFESQRNRRGGFLKYRFLTLLGFYLNIFSKPP